MAGLIGKKVGMTSLYSAAGKYVPCTVIEAGPCVVTQVKTKETDGYEAVQIAFGERKDKHTSAAMKGHFVKAGTTPKRKLGEFDNFVTPLKQGDIVSVDLFKEGDFVDVNATSKGRGFQGVVKRHGFSGVGASSHGQHDRSRAPGSLGASSWPSRVFKGMRMAGRMGGDNIKALNLEVMKVFPEKNVIVIKGSIPGAKGSFVKIVK